MSLTGHDSVRFHRPPPAACPRCACELHGARLCEVCGAADFHGEGLWVCFACGEPNAPLEDRCTRCRKDHVIACPACGREGYHKDRFCEFCGAARALYPVIVRLLAEASRPCPSRSPSHGRALSLTVLLAVIALSAASTLGVIGRRLEALAAGGSAAIAGAAAWILRRRPADGRLLS